MRAPEMEPDFRLPNNLTVSDAPKIFPTELSQRTDVVNWKGRDKEQAPGFH